MLLETSAETRTESRETVFVKNQYTGIAECYDLLMHAGYYDHEAMANAAHSVIGDRTRILELGVGTGLFAQCLLSRREPDCDLTGVDFTSSMLEIAQDRLGDEAELVEVDVTRMDLGETFDTAISSGGVWVVIDDADDGLLLGTHLFDYDQEVRGLRNVNQHLESDGLLLLSIQEMHSDLDLQLPEGVVYSQQLSPPQERGDDHFTIQKTYRFTRRSEVLAEETLTLGFYRRHVMDAILSEAGFEFHCFDRDRRFFVCSKKGQLETSSA